MPQYTHVQTTAVPVEVGTYHPTANLAMVVSDMGKSGRTQRKINQKSNICIKPGI